MMKEYPRLRELAYIIERVALRMRHTVLQERLLARGIDLLEAHGFQDFDRVLKIAAVIEELLVLGRELYEIEPFTVDCLQIELQELNTAILQFGSFAGLQDELPDLEEFFNKDKGNKKDEENQDSIIRQSAIADKIRQFTEENCQFKDIEEALPGISERTIRYDIQKLINKGVIERVGIGMGTYYKICSSNNTQHLSLS